MYTTSAGLDSTYGVSGFSIDDTDIALGKVMINPTDRVNQVGVFTFTLETCISFGDPAKSAMEAYRICA